MTITICMSLARARHRERLRAARVALLAALDVAINRAEDAGGAKAGKALRARRQALRDELQNPAIDTAETPEQLVASIGDDELRARYLALPG
jgi:hypothetical protein